MFVCPFCSALVNSDVQHARWHIRTDFPEGLPKVWEVGTEYPVNDWVRVRYVKQDYVDKHFWTEEEVLELMSSQDERWTHFFASGGYFMIEYIKEI